MEIRQRHVLALLLSLAIHLGITLAIGAKGGGANGTAMAPTAAANGLVVYLVKPHGAGPHDLPPLASSDKIAGETSAHATPAAPVAPRSIEDRPVQSTPTQAEAHFFRLGELTEEPIVMQGLVGDKLLVVPGLSAQSVMLQVLIDDQGHVEQVIVEDSRLSDEEKRLVIDAFSKVAFRPGKIGHIAVRSQLRIEIMVEDEIKL